jgi:dephospho-CoA kinase
MPSPAATPPVALVIVGMAGSGKSTLAAFLARERWPIVRFGDITMAELQRRGLPVQEPNERAIREELRGEHGMEAFAILSLPAINQALERAGRVAIDGLYSWSEYRYLKRRLHAKMIVVAVFTSRAERYQRLGSRGVRPLTVEEAESRDFAEIEKLEKGGPIALADHTIVNAGTVEELEQALARILRAEGVAVAAQGSSFRV